MSEITIKIKPQMKDRHFGKAVGEAKTYGGTFDAKTKTWSIPANENSLLTRMVALYNCSIVEYADLKGWAVVESEAA